MYRLVCADSDKRRARGFAFEISTWCLDRAARPPIAHSSAISSGELICNRASRAARPIGPTVHSAFHSN